MTTCEIINGDALTELRKLPSESIQCCVTSPPFYGLRDYGVVGQIGLEVNPAQFIGKLVEVFSEVRRVLKPDGILWLNLGDSYATGGGAVGRAPGGGEQGKRFIRAGMINTQPNRMPLPGLKPKDLIGIPWRVAFALQEDGWWLRGDIIWHKPNPMPESVRDRPTRSHEYIFQMTKSEKYYYDYEAVQEPMSLSSESRLAQDVSAQEGSARANGGTKTNGTMKAVGHGTARSRKDRSQPMPEDGRNAMRPTSDKQRGHSRRHEGFNDRWDKMERDDQCSGMRNQRSVWTISPAQYREAHFATFPAEIPRRCILAGSRPGDTVLDPFGGSGTTGMVAQELGRNAILIELNPEYCKLIRRRTAQSGLILT